MKLDKGNNVTFANIVSGLIKERNTINSDIHALFIRLLLISCEIFFFFFYHYWQRVGYLHLEVRKAILFSNVKMLECLYYTNIEITRTFFYKICGCIVHFLNANKNMYTKR